MRSPSSNTKGFNSAFCFFATSSRQICRMFRRSQMGSIPGRVQLNSLSTASMAPVARTASAGVVVACVAAEDVLVMNAPKLQVLAHTGASHQPEALAPAAFASSWTSGFKLFLEMDEDGVLMSGNHDIDVVRVNHPKANRGRVISGSPSMTSFSRLVSIRPYTPVEMPSLRQ